VTKEAEKKTTKATRKREPRAKQKAQVVHQIVERVEKKLAKELEKASLADYIKLVQLEKQLEAEDPRDIKVTWVEPSPTKSESEE